MSRFSKAPLTPPPPIPRSSIQKSLLLENTKADFMGKLDDLEEKLSDAQHQKEMLQAKLETQLAVEAEEHRRLQERTKAEIRNVLRAQEALEASNEELRIKAGNLQRTLTKGENIFRCVLAYLFERARPSIDDNRNKFGPQRRQRRQRRARRARRARQPHRDHQ